jgi:hypothetical protein
MKTGYGLDDRGSIPGRDNEGGLFPSPLHQNRLCGLLSLLSNEYQGLFPWE